MTNNSSENTSSRDTNTGDNNRTDSKRRRVNISIHPDLHDKSCEYAEDHGKTFSSLITDALLREMDPSQAQSQSTQLQPVLHRIEDIESILDNLEKTVSEISNQLDHISNSTGLDSQIVADRIEAVLEDAEEPLTIPDLVGRLSFQPERLKEGLEYLEYRFVVERLEPQGETDLPQWQLL